MAEPIITQVACPDCLRPIDVREHGPEIVCAACGGQFRLSGHLCIRCFSYSQEEEKNCAVCGAALVRQCEVCATVNWMGDEVCVRCDAVLGGEEILKLFRDEHVTNRLRRQMHQAHRLQAVEAQAAEIRSAELAALEEERRAAAQRARDAAQVRERRLILIALGALAIFIILLVAVALLVLNGG